MTQGERLEEGYDRRMNARIGIANTDKLIEIVVDNAKTFKKEIESVIAEDGMGWFTDTRGRSVGIPARNVAFVELDDSDGGQTVGFAPNM